MINNGLKTELELIQSKDFDGILHIINNRCPHSFGMENMNQPCRNMDSGECAECWEKAKRKYNEEMKAQQKKEDLKWAMKVIKAKTTCAGKFCYQCEFEGIPCAELMTTESITKALKILDEHMKEVV